jgi:hypothetical protein
MGLANGDGKISETAISVFAEVFSGLFYDDVCYCCGSQEIQELCGNLKEICENGDCRRAYLFLSLCHDRMRKPLPDPIWWLAGNPAAVEAFMKCFVLRLGRLVEQTVEPLREENEREEV